MAHKGRWSRCVAASLALAGVLLAAPASAAVTNQPVRFGQAYVHIGDTMGKVRDLAGPPDSRARRRDHTYWTYERSARTPRPSVIEFTDGRVSSTRLF